MVCNRSKPKTMKSEQADMQADQIERIAKAIEEADRIWREKAGYTGSPVHRPAYFWSVANHLLKSGEIK